VSGPAGAAILGWAWWAAGAALCLAALRGYLRSLRRVGAAAAAGPPREDLWLVALHQSLFVALLAGAPLLGALDREGRWPWRLAGGALAAAGHWRNSRAAAALGSACTPFMEPAGPPVRSGPYARARHPMYGGQLLLAAGTPLLFGRPELLAVSLAAGAVLWRRAALEDAALDRADPGGAAARRRLARFFS
jgi:protein-S-isoprenylcysteine O-methyltransferase Ste14